MHGLQSELTGGIGDAFSALDDWVGESLLVSTPENAYGFSDDKGFVDDHALILYVYVGDQEDPGAEESVLTVSRASVVLTLIPDLS